MVVASFLDAVQFVSALCLEGSRRGKRSSSRGHQSWRTGTTASFLSIDLTIALASGLAPVLGSQRRFLRHDSKCLLLR